MQLTAKVLKQALKRFAMARTWWDTAALAPLFATVYALGWWLRFEGQLEPPYSTQLLSTIGFVVALKLFVFVGLYGYQCWGRYLTFHDLGALTQASTVSALLLVVADYLVLPQTDIPRSVFFLDWGATVVAVGAVQAVGRWVQERGVNGLLTRDGEPALIVGANDSGEALLRVIRRDRELPYRVAGFVAADASVIGTRIGGVPVIGTIEQTCALAVKRGIRQVFITAGELSGKQVRQLVNDAQRHQVSVRVLPCFKQLLQGRLAYQTRDVSIEDLLRREPVKLDQRGLREWIDGRAILVTGSAGSIGSEICRQLLRFSPRQLILVDRSENGQFFLEQELRHQAREVDLQICIADAGDRNRMHQLFEQYQPEIVFHAAAYKHVPLMEQNRGEAVKNIIALTRKLADLADEHRVQSFVMISTDKAVNPTSVMGACKRVAELYVQSLAKASACRFVTVRFGNVLDSAGSVVPIFREQIARGGPVTVTHPQMTRYFMTIPEASQLVIQAGTMGHGGEIFVLDMGEPVRILDLARDMIQLSGLRVGEDIEIEFMGTRPGEKLYEELHVEGELHVATSHPKIMVADSQQLNRHEVIRAIRRLSHLSNGPLDLILDELCRIVPQFEHEQLSRPTRPAAIPPQRKAA